MCLQMAKGDLDFLKERNTCSACCLCSVLTIDGGACKTQNKVSFLQVSSNHLRTAFKQDINSSPLNDFELNTTFKALTEDGNFRMA